MRIAVLGLGQMGRGIATHLLDTGHTVSMWNRTPGRAPDLVGRGAREAADIADAVRDVDAALMVLADDAAVMQVVEAPAGLLTALPRSAALVDMSTVSPKTSRRLAELFPGRFLDSPIMGSPQATASGQARLLVGGPDDLVETLDGLLHDLGAGYTHTGPNGSATTLKILSNMLLVGGITLLSEVIAIGQANGVADDQLRSFFEASPMVAPGLKNRFEAVLAGEHTDWFSVRLAAKDAHLALGLASTGRLTAEVGQAVERTLQKAVSEGHGDEDLSAVVEAIRRDSA